MITPIFALLLLGHVLADFVFQSDALVARKRARCTRWRGLRQHTVILYPCHLVVLLIVPSMQTFAAVAVLVVAHILIDWLKLWTDDAWQRPLTFFLIDQFLHLLTLAGAALWLDTVRYSVQLDQPALLWCWSTALYLSAWVLAWRGGAFLVAMLLEVCKLGTVTADPAAAGAPNLGRVIGVLERLLIVTLVLQHAWAGIGLFVAAKSVARFKDLEDRAFAEYYLVGTLASVLVAVAVGLGIQALLPAS